MTEEKKQPLELAVINAQGAHDKLVPKLCTSVFFKFGEVNLF